MADIFSKEKRSEIMSKIRSKNTKPELLVRKYLFAQGFRFRLHQKTLPGRPDIVLKKFKVVVLINGCFWHGHDSCNNFKMPASRQDYWRPKIEKNISKDNEAKQKLIDLGWKVFVVWECQLKASAAEKTLSRLTDEILQLHISSIPLK